MTNGSWAGYESAATPTNDTVVACTDACGTENVWVGDGYCDDGGPGSDFSVCALGTDCTDCGERISQGDSRRLGVAGMDAKVDAQNRVQVAFTEEGSSFTALQYIFRDAQGNWSEPLEIDGQVQTIDTTLVVTLQWTLTLETCPHLYTTTENLAFHTSMI